MNDPRAVANYIVELAHEDARPVTNIVLQKLVYFSHAFFLLENGRPLVTGYFEAWTYGPVHPAVYKAFREFGAKPITSAAVKHDLITGVTTPIPTIDNNEARRSIRSVMANYARLSAGQLVELSHAINGPWHFTVENAKNNANIGLRITDDVTRERFKFLKLAIGKRSEKGEPDEDTPFS
ncbi:type VI toxin-antitoxin system SocA family antitoxin [Rhizobium sp. Rhizsp82]|uniref:type VI toxin-antitoxin system SocA family antitoxin n=1 Tax=Rhizobium sp. Rhizsp82 TaxID=3243057 RepID=UPI0039B52157